VSCCGKAISGLLSLGYEIGAILNRRTETWYDANGLQVTKESIKELQKEFVQIKVRRPCLPDGQRGTAHLRPSPLAVITHAHRQLQGKNRMAVVALADQLKLSEHHIPQSFLQLYFRKLQKEKNDQTAAPSTPPPSE
jgi:hypothetical protein